MRSFTVAERRNRLARRHFLSAEHAAETARPLTEIAAALVGLHATDPATPYLSLWARYPGFTTADLEQQLYERRSLVKQLAMRRTVWVLRTEDLAMIQPAVTDRVADNERRRLAADVQKAGLADDGHRWLDRASAEVLRYLGEHGTANARELRTQLPALAGRYDYAPGKRWGGETPLAPRVLTVLSASGAIVRGPNEGAWTTSRPKWTTVANWLGDTPQPMPAGKARAELVRVWLRSFGPATVTDVKWWFGATMTAARQALRDVDAVAIDLDGAPGFALPDDLEPEPDMQPWCALLPGLDVTTMGWYQRDWYLGSHRDQLFDRSGNAGPTAWWNGRVVGGWSQDADGRVRVKLLENPGRDGHRALSRRADQLTDWLGGVRISPRFPSALSKDATARRP